MVTKSSDSWISLPTAISLARRPEESDEIAWRRLVDRLSVGGIRSKAGAYVEREEGHQVCSLKGVEVKTAIWANLRWEFPLDLVMGRVRGIGSIADDNRPFEVELNGMQLWREDLADLKSGASRGGGRPHGDFWPDLTEELVVYFYERGPPADSTPVGRICEEILVLLEARGARAPGSPQPLRPVVQAIVERLRECEAR
ncbi:hypothetical protein [Sphingomonas endolithica]|uniref:hypothetical protein n=1 Tax=Sphingomonas endolithica TaxID=2972485 RepID=UPI0021B077D9|nr:hypothetical protein [Sphingomonas sp. ZFBP2030]